MPNSFTANLNLEKPEVGADANLWGGHLNGDLDILDSIFTTATTRPIASKILSSTKYVDVTTTSKTMMLAMSSISAGATRTLTVQDSDGTIALLSNISGMATTGDVAAATVGMVDTSSAQIISNKGFAASTTATAAQATTATTLLASVGYADRVAVQQIAYTKVSSVATGNTAVPYDDTPPLNTEGDEYMTLAFTPKSATSKLLIQVKLYASSNAQDNPITALFQDSTATSLAAVVSRTDAGNAMYLAALDFEMVSGTTSATTFKVRSGSSSLVGGTITFNGITGTSRLLGGVFASSITITEIGI